MQQTKILLDESEIPTHWYNVVADMPNPPAPPLGPDGKPIGPEALTAIFPMSLIEQEMSAERWIPIPDKVREIYRLWRPSPLYRAHRLEAVLGTPAKIYYKYEGVSPAGSHKVNTSVAQAYYNAEAGIKRIATETGAGQWGCSMALAGQMFGLEVRVYMVKVSYGQKPYRRSMMQTWGAEVFASPSMETQSGRAALAEDPDNPGVAGPGDFGGGGGCGVPSRHQLRARIGAEPRVVAPDRDRPRGEEAVREGGRLPGHDLRPVRRRLQFRRRGLSVFRRQGGWQEGAPGGGRGHPVPDADARSLRLRFRRHGEADADDVDVHPRPRLHAARYP